MLTDQERVRIINKEIEIDVIKEVPVQFPMGFSGQIIANNFNTVTESISVSSNGSQDQLSKLNSLDNSLPEF